MHAEMSTREVLPLVFVFLPIHPPPLLSSVTLFRMRVSKCQPADYRILVAQTPLQRCTVVNGLISRFHGHRESCQSQYVRRYKSKPSIRALKRLHTASRAIITTENTQTHTRWAHLSQFCAKRTSLEKCGPMMFPVDVFNISTDVHRPIWLFFRLQLLICACNIHVVHYVQKHAKEAWY